MESWQTQAEELQQCLQQDDAALSRLQQAVSGGPAALSRLQQRGDCAGMGDSLCGTTRGLAKLLASQSSGGQVSGRVIDNDNNWV